MEEHKEKGIVSIFIAFVLIGFIIVLFYVIRYMEVTAETVTFLYGIIIALIMVTILLFGNGIVEYRNIKELPKAVDQAFLILLTSFMALLSALLIMMYNLHYGEKIPPIGIFTFWLIFFIIIYPVFFLAHRSGKKYRNPESPRSEQVGENQ